MVPVKKERGSENAPKCLQEHVPPELNCAIGSIGGFEQCALNDEAKGHVEQSHHWKGEYGILSVDILVKIKLVANRLSLWSVLISTWLLTCNFDPKKGILTYLTFLLFATDSSPCFQYIPRSCSRSWYVKVARSSAATRNPRVAMAKRT